MLQENVESRLQNWSNPVERHTYELTLITVLYQGRSKVYVHFYPPRTLRGYSGYVVVVDTNNYPVKLG